MSSWSLLLALSGFRFNTLDQTLRLAPAHRPEDFRCFFSGPEGWGSVTQKLSGKVQTMKIAVKSGRVNVKKLELAVIAKNPSLHVTASLDGVTLPATVDSIGAHCTVNLGTAGLAIQEGRILNISLA
jgi:hypothetical protein